MCFLLGAIPMVGLAKPIFARIRSDQLNHHILRGALTTEMVTVYAEKHL